MLEIYISVKMILNFCNSNSQWFLVTSITAQQQWIYGKLWIPLLLCFKKPLKSSNDSSTFASEAFMCVVLKQF